MIIWLLVHFGRWRLARWLLHRFVRGEVFYVGPDLSIFDAFNKCVPFRGDVVIVPPHHVETVR